MRPEQSREEPSGNRFEGVVQGFVELASVAASSLKMWLANRRTERSLTQVEGDEANPSRVAPSAEGEVTFAGLSQDVRKWVDDQVVSVKNEN